METIEKNLLAESDAKPKEGTGRRAFLHRAAIAGAIGAAGLGSILTLANPLAEGRSILGRDDHDRDHDHDEDADDLKKRDHDILIAAEIAEALAVTTYTNIIDGAPFSAVWNPMTKGTSSLQGKRKCPTICWNSPLPTNLRLSNPSFIPKACFKTRRQH